MKDEAILGLHVRVIEAMAELVTSIVTELPYSGRPMDDLTREELRLLVCSLLGLIEAMNARVGEEATLRMVRSVAMPAQRGANRG